MNVSEANVSVRFGLLLEHVDIVLEEDGKNLLIARLSITELFVKRVRYDGRLMCVSPDPKPPPSNCGPKASPLFDILKCIEFPLALGSDSVRFWCFSI